MTDSRQIHELSNRLSHQDASVRGEAAHRLRQILEEAWPGRRYPLPDVMPAYYIRVCPLLARAVTTESDVQALSEMVQLAAVIGPSGPPLVEGPTLIDALVARMKESEFHSPEYQMQGILGNQILDAICSMGAPARILAIQQARDMAPWAHHAAVATLVVGDTLLYSIATSHSESGLGAQGLHREALALLADSAHEEDWLCLASIAHVFAEGVPRRELRHALVTVWRKSSGAVRAVIERSL